MRSKLLVPILLLSGISGSLSAQNVTGDAMKFAQHQTDVLLQETAKAKAAATKPDVFSPRTIDTKGNLVLVNPDDWCSGFFAGNLWFLYEYTGDAKWKTEAQKFDAIEEPEKTHGNTHDVGFKLYNSLGNGYRLTHNAHYKEVVITSAKTLITRFNPTVGCIRSWDYASQWKYPVIIDNMMNLELLFEATKLTGDSAFYKIAVTHANTTMKNHFRPDYSSFHVIDYDPQTGNVLHKQTAQGYADGSAWARGQAWGLYGYTMCYRETHDKRYLKQAENIAKFILNNPTLPKDLVPYWDYNAPGIPNHEPRDASAAAVMASAFYELSTYSANSKLYKTTADKILNSLHSSYQAQPGGTRGFLLLHSTGHKPEKSEIDVPIIYADYYYLEALLRQKRIKEHKPVINVAGKLKN